MPAHTMPIISAITDNPAGINTIGPIILFPKSCNLVLNSGANCRRLKNPEINNIANEIPSPSDIKEITTGPNVNSGIVNRTATTAVPINSSVLSMGLIDKVGSNYLNVRYGSIAVIITTFWLSWLPGSAIGQKRTI